MASNSNFSKGASEDLESNKEIKSYINQQILDFEPFITSSTLILVIARDPQLCACDLDIEIEAPEKLKPANHRIVIILKEGEISLEAEAFHDNIFEAIKLAKEKLVIELLAIQNEIENSQERLMAIQQAGNPNQVH